nr:tRNA (cytosine-5-)-methyltransferase [Polyrhizophydium stewartii]
MLSDPVKTFSQPGSDSDGRDTEPAWKPTPPQISSYLQPLEDVSPHLVPQEYILKRKSFRFDLVKPTDRISSCFTKAYGSHHVIGSGSFLQTERLDVRVLAFNIVLRRSPLTGVAAQVEFAVDDGPSVVAARPRFFRPTEVARLHGFPIDGPPRGDPRLHAMAFPDSLSVAQQLKLLGNSLSVDVVAHLLSGLLAANAD